MTLLLALLALTEPGTVAVTTVVVCDRWGSREIVLRMGA